MSTTSSKNFTTLYSGTGSVVPQGAYGNANVVSLLNVGTDGGNTVANIVATGNVTAASIGNGYSQIQFSPIAAGPIYISPIQNGQYPQLAIHSSTSPNATVEVRNTLSVFGNIRTPIVNSTFINNAGNITVGTPVLKGNIELVNSFSALKANGSISAVGNITTDGFFIGNLLGNVSGNILAAGSNTQVQFNDSGLLGATAGFTFNKTSNVLAVTGNITGGNVAGTIVSASGNVVAGNVTTGGVVSATGNVQGGNVLTAGQVSATGNVTGGNVLTAGQVSATGNVTGNYILGNGSQLTGLPAVYGNANVSNFLANGFGSNTIVTTGNITAGNVLGNVFTAPGNANVIIRQIDAVNQANAVYVDANNLIIGNVGNSSKLVAVSTNQLILAVSGSGGPQMYFGPASTGNVDLRSSGGAISGGFAANGNINLSGNVFIGNAASDTAPASTGLNLSVAGTITSAGNITTGNLLTGGVVSATGNINGANLVASANLTSTQQTIVGTANNGSTGNIVMSGKNIATDMAWLPDGGSAATAVNGRIVVGTGWNGNISHTGVQSRLGVFDSVTRSATSTNVRSLDIDTQVSLTGNVTSNGFRQQGLGSRIRVGGGAAGNTINITSPGAGSVGTVAALQPNIDVGNVSPYFLGNTTVSHAMLNGGFITTYAGGFVGNAYGMVPGAFAAPTGNAFIVGNIVNYTGFTNNLGASPFITGNLYAFYHGNVVGSAEQSATGIATAAAARAATNYYAFRNDDAVAQVQLGSLRSYNEFEFAANTSGTVNINKTNAQVQYISPTANVTIGDFQNFVSVANDGTNNDLQTDTVTLIIQQGATPYTVTMPTGNAEIKYLGNVTTVGSTANAVSIVTIKALKSLGNATGSTLYLTAISSEYT